MEITGFADYSQIKWSSEYSVGVSELDSQHKELMDFFDEVVAHCSGKKPEEREYFDKAIDAFIDRLAKHFGTEELFLFGKNYAQYEAHKLDHAKLLEKIRFVKSEIQGGRWGMKLFILAKTLKTWFMHHFTSYDITAKEYFAEETAIQADGIEAAKGESYFALQG